MHKNISRSVWAVMIVNPGERPTMDNYYDTYEEACAHASRIPWIYETEIEEIMLEEA